MTNTFVIADPDRCLGCYTCMAACSVNHRKEGLQAQPRLFLTHSPVGTMPVQCHHCENAPCSLVCPVQAITIGDQGVQLNEGLCIGCKMCAYVCPFGAVTVNGTNPPAREEPLSLKPSLLDWVPGKKQVAIKCDLCTFSSEGPACVQACPTKALQVVTGEDMEEWSKFRRLHAVADMMALIKGREVPDR